MKGVYHRKCRPVADRYWEKVVRGDNPDDCWQWMASTSSGYGQLSGGPEDAYPVHAHRVSWELHNGPIPDGLWVLHRCDNPPCTNPRHLFLGTLQDNVADATAKGRMGGPPQPGELNPGAKLTAAQVEEIRNAEGLHREIAARYGITKSYVSNLKRGEKWAHTYQGKQT